MNRKSSNFAGMAIGYCKISRDMCKMSFDAIFNSGRRNKRGWSVPHTRIKKTLPKKINSKLFFLLNCLFFYAYAFSSNICIK